MQEFRIHIKMMQTYGVASKAKPKTNNTCNIYRFVLYIPHGRQGKETEKPPQMPFGRRTSWETA